MGGWMDSKREIKVGDYVVYSNGEIVVDENKKPVKIVAIKPRKGYAVCVIYCDGQFDKLSSVRKCHALLLELM
jgi:hypothetical protein